MTHAAKPYVAAAVQAAPVFLDLDGSVAKACDLIADAARGGARLIVFPEAFLSGYPEWVWRLPISERAEQQELYAAMVDSAVDVPGPAIERLAAAARAANAIVAIGITERNRAASRTSLYNSLAWLAADGTLMGCHRKLVPTSGERLVWGPGDGSTLAVHDTPLGRLGGLICWENYMPLARYALYAWGEQVHLAPTWDRGEPWLATLRHIAREGRVYVIGACQAFRLADIPERWPFRRLYPPERTWINGGESTIVDPNGAVLAGPMKEQEGIVYAEIDPAKVTGSRWMMDAGGHYARPDVFKFAVRREPAPHVGEWSDAPGGKGMRDGGSQPNQPVRPARTEAGTDDRRRATASKRRRASRPTSARKGRR